MSIDYEVTKIIDHENPSAKEQYDRYLQEWQKKCCKKVVSRKTWRKGGRTLKRALDRKDCHIVEKEPDGGNKLIHVFKKGDHTISKLIVTFENYEPEEESEQEPETAEV